MFTTLLQNKRHRQFVKPNYSKKRHWEFLKTYQNELAFTNLFSSSKKKG